MSATARRPAGAQVLNWRHYRAKPGVHNLDAWQLMLIFVAGICGTFMAGLALLAREKGFRVSGCDTNVYPPMSDQLRAAGIEVLQGYECAHLERAAVDVVVIGNALSRGNPLVEFVLDAGIP